MTTLLTVRSPSGAYRNLIAYKGKDGRCRAFPTSRDGRPTEAEYVGKDVMSIRDQIALDGDKVVNGQPIRN